MTKKIIAIFTLVLMISSLLISCSKEIPDGKNEQAKSANGNETANLDGGGEENDLGGNTDEEASTEATPDQESKPNENSDTETENKAEAHI